MLLSIDLINTTPFNYFRRFRFCCALFWIWVIFDCEHQTTSKKGRGRRSIPILNIKVRIALRFKVNVRLSLGPKSLQQTAINEDYKCVAVLKLCVFLYWIIRDRMVNCILVAIHVYFILNSLYANNNYNENQSRYNNLSNNKDDMRYRSIFVSLYTGKLRVLKSSMWIIICYFWWFIDMSNSSIISICNQKISNEQLLFL